LAGLGITEEDTSWLESISMPAPAEQVREGEEFETMDLRTGEPQREVLPPKVVTKTVVKKSGVPGWMLPVGVAAVAAYFIWKG
jgi:hypothetical protein